MTRRQPTPNLEEQHDAASADARAILARAGLGDEKPSTRRDLPDKLSRLFDIPKTCCSHLRRRPLQPMFAILTVDPVWRCRPCHTRATKKRLAHLRAGAPDLGHTEEHTCDYCRTLTDNLTPCLLREGVFILTLSICSRCTIHFRHLGANTT